jgi:hypothetical protein
MPFLRRLLRRHGFRLEPMSVGMPTSTPAFQMAMMYGVRPDIPGFHYHDKRRQADVYFPRAQDTALEAAQTRAWLGFLRRMPLRGQMKTLAFGCKTLVTTVRRRDVQE